jgi:hypothetical protein
VASAVGASWAFADLAVEATSLESVIVDVPMLTALLDTHRAQSNKPVLREQLATGIFNIGLRLGALDRSVEEGQISAREFPHVMRLEAT